MNKRTRPFQVVECRFCRMGLLPYESIFRFSYTEDIFCNIQLSISVYTFFMIDETNHNMSKHKMKNSTCEEMTNILYK